MHHHAQLYVVLGIELRPHVCAAMALLTELSLQPSSGLLLPWAFHVYPGVILTWGLA